MNHESRNVMDLPALQVRLDELLVDGQLRDRPVAADDQAWEFDVYYTTMALRQRGIIEAARSRVEVLAPDFLEAQRLAVWMVVCRSGFYVTRAEYVI